MCVSYLPASASPTSVGVPGNQVGAQGPRAKAVNMNTTPTSARCRGEVAVSVGTTYVELILRSLAWLVLPLGVAHAFGDGTTTRVSVSSSGAQGNGPSYNPSISADGNSVVFCS